MTIIERAKLIRKIIEQMAENLTDDQALAYPEVFPVWNPSSKQYKTGDRISYIGKLYRVLQDHISQADWTPDVAVSLYTEIDDPAIEYPEWKQPAGAHDAYAKGAKVKHKDQHWISIQDGNIWEPGVYGWEAA